MDRFSRQQVRDIMDNPLAALTNGKLAAAVNANLVAIPEASRDNLRRYEALRALSTWSASVYVDGPPS